jgi:UDP-3-O-[3-hydroxymyristoyl] glucosamine N-acyltransferase
MGHVVAGFLDDRKPLGTEVITGINVVGSPDSFDPAGDINGFICAIGDNKARELTFMKLNGKLSPFTFVHPTAAISADATLGPGSIILPKAVVMPRAVLGTACLMDALSLVDHDSLIGDFVHVGRGVLIGSECKIESYTYLDDGTIVKSRTTR